MAQGILYYSPARQAFCLNLNGNKKEMPAERSEMNRGAYASILEEMKNNGVMEAPEISVDMVLSHEMYGVDYITLPSIKRNKLEEAFNAELQSTYKNEKDLTFQKSELANGKTVTYRTVFVRKDLVTDLKEGFKGIGIKIDRFIPEGCALLEGAANLEPAVMKSGSLVLNVGETESYLAACGKEMLLGGFSIPFGLNALSDSRVLAERQLYNPEASELLVVNAKERAKSTRLTMAIDLEEEIDDDIPDDDEIIEPNPELPDLTEVGRDGAAGYGQEDEYGEEERQEEDKPVVRVKTMRRKIRTLPKFMRREEPDTPEGYVLENFRMLEKRVLMLARDMALTDYYPPVETICVAVPDEYAFLVDRMGEQNPSYRWVRLTESGEALTVSGAPRVSGGKMPVF